MTIKEYYEKRNNLEQTNPAPDGLSFSYVNQWYRDLIEKLQLELSDEDRFSVTSRERAFSKRMAN